MANPEKWKANGRKDYQANPQARIAAAKRWQAENADKAAAYRETNKETIKQRGKEWAKANPERARARTAKYRTKPGTKETEAKWRANNPEIRKAIKQRYRAALAAAEGNHTASELKALFVKQGGKCAYCQTSIKNGYDADHIQPLSKGGSNWIVNIQLLCGPCNNRKWATDPIEYARRIGRLL